MIKVYIAGPIAGKPDGNKMAFDMMEYDLATIGLDPRNPWSLNKSHEGECPPGPRGGEDTRHTIPCHMLTDLKALLDCEWVLFLPGWEHSAGAFVEFTIARATGKLMFFSFTELMNHWSDLTLAAVHK